jgi:NAD+--dinitrogen-reductase ADP-D-ribosyltransferase
MDRQAERSGVWRAGDGTNLIGIAPGFFGSIAFNDRNTPVHIAGCREMNAELFRLLAAAASLREAGETFAAYMAAMFGLANSAGEGTSDGDGNGDRRRPAAPRPYRASYLRLLRGWAFDSNSIEGAVLKGWVESRFGLFPTFHRVPLAAVDSPAWARYIEEKMGSRFHNNAILSQLDLLYEFAQWALARFLPDQEHCRLFRGVTGFAEHPLIERRDRRHVVLRLNNLISFTRHRDMAGWFGDWILEALVPRAKILFFPELLPRHPLKGEGEVLALGGDYLVRAAYD